MEYEEIKDTILCNYEPCSGDVENAQMLNGEWYAPLWGCDTLSNCLDDLKKSIKKDRDEEENICPTCYGQGGTADCLCWDCKGSGEKKNNSRNVK